MGQLDLYNGLGKARSLSWCVAIRNVDLVNAVTKKVDSFRTDFLTELFEEKKIHLVVRGSGKRKESSWW